MSREAIAFVKTLDVPVSSHKLLLWVLADKISNETGEAYVDQALLVRECCKSERQIRYIVTALEAAGLIQRRKAGRANGGDAYTIIGFMPWLNGERS